jgi:hypothetical protein
MGKFVPVSLTRIPYCIHPRRLLWLRGALPCLSSLKTRPSEVIASDEFLQIGNTSFRPVHVAHGIRRHAFRHGLFVRLRSDSRNECLHRTVFGAADPNAPFEARIALRIRLGIGHINCVVPVYEDPARPAELLPFF